MSKIKIITDSSCDLNKCIVQKYNIGIVGLNVSFGEETYIDGEMDNDTFYKRMAECKELPKTSCPSPEKFVKSYEGEDEILVLTLSSKLSATYSTAVLAKNMILEENQNKRIEVIDTQTGSVGQGLLVVKAAQLAKEGKSLSEIVEIIEKMKNNIVFFGSLETLENAIKGGRINPLAGKLINALNFKEFKLKFSFIVLNNLISLGIFIVLYILFKILSLHSFELFILSLNIFNKCILSYTNIGLSSIFSYLLMNLSISLFISSISFVFSLNSFILLI